ncbi:MAG: hypothetical protein COW00_10945 [Bdellovibrio sp. CG12_big_fil_rev_8_21_14_0_65_39_13]|nr:MAG: hypothetical protein COW00_10945 [Bdellovibrio sp. CG12_big_fil_rev_8_21_14_0_65_39_13]PIR32250.1 MAG: hypothetical protein COV37_20235 [Bdellovibrio sp. CG11_big_fil_rev_8_21_14_0_20_39_38]
MKKILLPLALLLTLTSCASKSKDDSQTAAKQVSGLQAMCKDSTPAMKKRQEDKSLYLRLGGEKKIEALVTSIYIAHKKNEQIGHMLAHVDKDRFIKNVTQFLVVGTGGKGKYSGRNMKDAHSHLNVSNSDFMSAGNDVQNSMKSMNYGENEIQEVVCALVSFIPQVVVR